MRYPLIVVRLGGRAVMFAATRRRRAGPRPCVDEARAPTLRLHLDAEEDARHLDALDSGDAMAPPDRLDVTSVGDVSDVRDVTSEDRLVPLPAVYATENVPVRQILARGSTTFAHGGGLVLAVGVGQSTAMARCRPAEWMPAGQTTACA